MRQANYAHSMSHNPTRPRARLYTEERLRHHSTIMLPAKQVHYLISVLRVRAGEHLVLFNASDGEWQGEITFASKKSVEVKLSEKLREAKASPDLWLLFAPIKAGRIDFLVEKATELGVSHIFPIHTDYTNASRVNHERLHAQAIEAAEQCERFDIPQLHDYQPLEKRLCDWPPERVLLYCDESGGGQPLGEAIKTHNGAKLAVLVGPEGGFSPKERDWLRRQPYTVAVGLGPRILRAETAALTALACIQCATGDWQRMPDFKGES